MRLLRLLLLVVVAAGAGGGGWVLWERSQAETIRPARPSAAARAQTEPPVPVLVANVLRRDVPLFRDGIGNIQAYASVTIRAQIDGRLIAVEFREGQDVRRGDVLARIDPTTWQAQLDQALARRAQNQATLANARVDLERYERLAATNAGSRQQADSQRTLVAQLEAQVKGDDAAIENARAVLGYTIIRSPIDGRAGLRAVDAGNIVRPGDTNGIVTIAQVQPVAALFTLPQRDLAIVQEAQARGPVMTTVLDSEGRGARAIGELEVIDNQVDVATGTFKLKAVFPNADRRLWPGQFVSVRVHVADLVGAAVVPTPAVRRGPQGPFVYVIDGQSVAQVRPVTIRHQDDAMAVVERGLNADERVVTSGFTRLAPGRNVAAQPDPEAAALADQAPVRGPRS